MNYGIMHRRDGAVIKVRRGVLVAWLALPRDYQLPRHGVLASLVSILMSFESGRGGKVFCRWFFPG